MIKLENVCKIYSQGSRRIEILKNINLEINSGEKIAIIGRSGSGKTTLLNILSGLSTMDEGKYYYKEKEITNKIHGFREAKIGMILQNYALLNDRTAFQNIEIPLQYRRIKKEEREKEIESIAESLELESLLKNMPEEMSGGECQRVAIARALVKKPEIILADEPTGALDSKSEDTVMNILMQTDKTLVLVTHNEGLTNKCDRVYQLEDGELRCFY